MIGRLCRVLLAASLTVLMALAPASSVFAQQSGASTPPSQPQQQQQPPPALTIPESNQNYTYGKRWFPNIIAPYTQAFVPEPVLTNAPRIEQMVQNGKLSISLQDAVDLALQNNLSIVIERYVPWIAEANILRTLSGAPPISGSVVALGTIPAQSFDPQITSAFSLDEKGIPVNNPIIAGTGGSAAVGNIFLSVYAYRGGRPGI